MPASGEVKCLGCSRWFRIRSVQTHLNWSHQCRMKYSQSAYSKLIELCEAEKKKKISDRKARNYQNLNQQKKVTAHVSKSDDSSVSNDKQKCKGCLREFTRLLTHLQNTTSNCMSKYSQEELEKYKTQKRNKSIRHHYHHKKKKSNQKEPGEQKDGQTDFSSKPQKVSKPLEQNKKNEISKKKPGMHPSDTPKASTSNETKVTLIVKLKGAAKIAQFYKNGFYNLAPTKVNDKAYWSQEGGDQAIWYDKESECWSIGLIEDLGSSACGMYSNNCISPLQATTWNYWDSETKKSMTTNDIVILSVPTSSLVTFHHIWMLLKNKLLFGRKSLIQITWDHLITCLQDLQGGNPQIHFHLYFSQ